MYSCGFHWVGKVLRALQLVFMSVHSTFSMTTWFFSRLFLHSFSYLFTGVMRYVRSRSGKVDDLRNMALELLSVGPCRALAAAVHGVHSYSSIAYFS